MTTIDGRPAYSEPLTWRQTITRASYYSFGIATLWAATFVLWQIFGVPHP